MIQEVEGEVDYDDTERLNKMFARIGPTCEVVPGGMATNSSMRCCLCRHVISGQNGGGDVICYWCLIELRPNSAICQAAWQLRQERLHKKEKHDSKTTPVGAG